MKNIVAFGNPLLDTTVYLKDTSLLKKYNIKEDDQKEIKQETMKALSSDLLKYKQYNTAGGCAQNTLRVMQWLFRKNLNTVIFGSVGNDEDAKVLQQLLAEDGVKTRYATQLNFSTGKAFAIITGINRTLVAHLGAAEILTIENLKNIEDFKPILLSADYVYIEGFFLTNRVDTAKYVLNFCKKHQKTLVFSIAGKYVCEMMPETIKYFIKNADIVLGNKSEFEALRCMTDMETPEKLIVTLMKCIDNNLEQYGKILVITDGPNPVTCYYGKGSCLRLELEKVENGLIKDTTGAGDAFTAGFLSGICQNMPVEECVKIGHYAAMQIIQQVGCTVPEWQPDINLS